MSNIYDIVIIDAGPGGIGGSISPSYMEIHADETIKEKKHSNLIYTAIKDAVTAVNGIIDN